MNDLEKKYYSEIFAWMRSRPRSERELREDLVGDYHIDTCAVDDREWNYETAIECRHFNNGNWVVVRGYETREEAEAGHATWCDKAKNGFQKLYDVYENRIYFKEESEKTKQRKLIRRYTSCKFTCLQCGTKVSTSVPLLEADAFSTRCPICKNILGLYEFTVEDTSIPGKVERMLGTK